MARERLFRRDEELGDFDWRTPANERAVDGDVARLYYETALHTALGDVQRAKPLYLRWLDRLVESRASAEPAPVVGRLTRLMFEESPGKYWTPEALAQLPPGKFTRVTIETTRDDLPGYDVVTAVMHALDARVAASGTTAVESAPRASKATTAHAPADRPRIPSGLTSLTAVLAESAARRERAEQAAAAAPSANSSTPPPPTTTPRKQRLATTATGRSAAARSAASEPRPEERVWLPPSLVAVWRQVPAPTVERPGVTLLRRELAPAEHGAADDPVIDQALDRRGQGTPLPDALRQEMEAVLGADLSRVRLHTDGFAGAAAHVIHARAFTVGEDIYFAPGAFDPDSPAGRELLAHELTHVVQAQRGRVPKAGAGESRVSQPGDAVEQEAEQVARRVAASPARTAESIGPEPGAPEVDARAASREPVVAGPSTLLRAPDPPESDAALRIPPGGAPVNQLGIVVWDHRPALHLRSSPSTTEDNVIGSLRFNTRVQVIQRFPGNWLLVATLDGKMGFCAQTYVWFAPEHKLPEPNARVHKVAGGEQGTAIAIARRYYGDIADKWGQDLRFYVSVLGAVNHVAVPNTTDGWKTVQFRENDLIWIPSAPFARSLHGALNSGSRSYEFASALGVEGILARVGELMDDFKEAIRLSGKYIPAAVARHVEDSVVSVLESLLWMAAGAAALMAISTAVGAAIGALAGGAGAAPGAAAGFEVGLALLEWIGLGFLVAWIGNAVVRIGTAFGAFFSAVWTARGDKDALDRAALAFADALGTLGGVLIEALAMWAISVGVKTAAGKLQATALGRQIGASRLGEWLDQRIKNHQTGKAPLPGPREALRRLLEKRRRGERDDEQAPKPAEPADAWSELAKRHNLDDVVTRILREERVDPEVAERLLSKGMGPFDLAEMALDHGVEGVRAADTLVQANVRPHVAQNALKMARDMGIGRQAIELINSKRLENLQGFRKFLLDVVDELEKGQLGKYNQLTEAYIRVMRGDRVSLEGRRQTPGDPESGQADLIDYTLQLRNSDGISGTASGCVRIEKRAVGVFSTV